MTPQDWAPEVVSKVVGTGPAAEDTPVGGPSLEPRRGSPTVNPCFQNRDSNRRTTGTQRFFESVEVLDNQFYFENWKEVVQFGHKTLLPVHGIELVM